MDGIFLTTELLPTREDCFRTQNTVDALRRPIDILYPPDTRGGSGLDLRCVCTDRGCESRLVVMGQAVVRFYDVKQLSDGGVVAVKLEGAAQFLHSAIVLADRRERQA